MPNMVVDALARIWSPAYQRITRAEGSARRLIEMRPAGIRTVWRELQCAGVPTPKIWELVAQGISGLYKTYEIRMGSRP
jgi:hypothetical protein